MITPHTGMEAVQVERDRLQECSRHRLYKTRRGEDRGQKAVCTGAPLGLPLRTRRGGGHRGAGPGQRPWAPLGHRRHTGQSPRGAAGARDTAPRSILCAVPGGWLLWGPSACCWARAPAETSGDPRTPTSPTVTVTGAARSESWGWPLL